MAMTMIGVPASRRGIVAARFTVPGAFSVAVPRYDSMMGSRQQTALKAVGAGIHRFSQSYRGNPYVEQMRSGPLDIPGLGDSESDDYDLGSAVDPFDRAYNGTYTNLAGGSWSDVAAAFVGPIGKAIGFKVTGANPNNTLEVQTQVLQQQLAAQKAAADKKNTWAVPVAIGGGLALVALLTLAMKKGR